MEKTLRDRNEMSSLNSRFSNCGPTTRSIHTSSLDVQNLRPNTRLLTWICILVSSQMIPAYFNIWDTLDSTYNQEFTPTLVLP